MQWTVIRELTSVCFVLWQILYEKFGFEAKSPLHIMSERSHMPYHCVVLGILGMSCDRRSLCFLVFDGMSLHYLQSA